MGSKQSSDSVEIEKEDVIFDENVTADHLENGALSPEHREYLLARHGTLDLDPIPSMDPADPLNWPSWKVAWLP